MFVQGEERVSHKVRLAVLAVLAHRVVRAVEALLALGPARTPAVRVTVAVALRTAVVARVAKRAFAHPRPYARALPLHAASQALRPAPALLQLVAALAGTAEGIQGVHAVLHGLVARVVPVEALVLRRANRERPLIAGSTTGGALRPRRTRCRPGEATGPAFPASVERFRRVRHPAAAGHGQACRAHRDVAARLPLRAAPFEYSAAAPGGAAQRHRSAFQAAAELRSVRARRHRLLHAVGAAELREAAVREAARFHAHRRHLVRRGAHVEAQVARSGPLAAGPELPAGCAARGVPAGLLPGARHVRTNLQGDFYALC